MYYIFDTNRPYSEEQHIAIIHSTLPVELTMRLLCFTPPAIEDIGKVLATAAGPCWGMSEDMPNHPCYFEIEAWLDPTVFLGGKYSFRDLNPAVKRYWYLLNRKEMQMLVDLWNARKFTETKVGDDREKYWRNRVRAVEIMMEEVWPKSVTSSGAATASTKARSTGAKRASTSRKSRQKTTRS